MGQRNIGLHEANQAGSAGGLGDSLHRLVEVSGKWREKKNY